MAKIELASDFEPKSEEAQPAKAAARQSGPRGLHDEIPAHGKKQLVRQAGGNQPQNEKLPAQLQQGSVPDQGHSLPALHRRLEQRLSFVNPAKVPSTKQHQAAFVLPPLPSRAASRNYSALIGFVICVLLPVVAAGIYYGFIASNQYVAEFRFTVKDSTPAVNPAAGSLLALAGSLGGDGTNNYLVADFLTSRDAIETLQKKVDVVDLYANSGADWWSRFNGSQPLERFVIYWQHMVSAHYDPVTGIVTATVRAFSPQDALLIANSLVNLSEELVNQLAYRTERNNVRFAESEVERAQNRLSEVQGRMTEYRNRVGVIDPTSSVVASNSTLVQTLQSNLAQLQAQIETLKRQNLSAAAPSIITLNNQINSVKEQLQLTEAAVARSKDGKPLSAVMSEYEQLSLERQFSQTMVTGAMQALDQARANANAQHLYITPYVRPSLPHSSVYPERIWSVVTVGAIAFAAWLVGLLVLRSIRERFV